MSGHWLGRRTGSEMSQPNTLGAEEAVIYQSFSGLPNYSKNFYLSWCCSNFQRKSNPLPTSFKTISNQITSPVRLLKNFNRSYVKMSPINCQFFFFKFCILANLQDISKFQIIKIFRDPLKFLKGQKSKGPIQRS